MTGKPSGKRRAAPNGRQREWRRAIILIVLLQEGHQKNVGVVTGGADTFFSKNKARSIDAFLARWTKVISVGFFAMVIIINIIMYFSA